MHVQSTAPRTVVAKSGMILPATITPEADMNLLATCIAVYHRLNERKVAYDTLQKLTEAMRGSSAVVALYADGKGEIAARVIWPSSVTLSASHEITCRGYCTLRGQMRSFRLDRLLTCHPLTTPDDMQEAA